MMMRRHTALKPGLRTAALNQRLMTAVTGRCRKKTPAARFVKKPFQTNSILWITWEPTQGRRNGSVAQFVVKDFHEVIIWNNTKSSTRGRNHLVVPSVVRNTHRGRLWAFTSDFIQEKTLTRAQFVEDLSVPDTGWLNTWGINTNMILLLRAPSPNRLVHSRCDVLLPVCVERSAASTAGHFLHTAPLKLMIIAPRMFVHW